MKERFFEAVTGLWTHHRGPFVGMSLGFLFAVLVLTIGFFPTIFLVLCSGIGGCIGLRVDRGGVLEELQDRLPDKLQWHRFS